MRDDSIPFDALSAWIIDALSFWAGHGLNNQGGFLEELALDGGTTGADFVRTRVICRQIYSFAQGAVLGWAPGAALVDAGCSYLQERARLSNGGWAKRLTSDGRVLDDAPDLYDLAFVIFAFAWRNRVSKDESAHRAACETLDFINAHLTAPGGGYWPFLPHDGRRLQNPHMHFAEACLSAYASFGDQRFLDQAHELIGLLRARFFDGRTLGEAFGEDWSREIGTDGVVLEPGHHFEWAWILAQYQAVTGEDVTREALVLTAFAEQHGTDPVTHSVYHHVRDDGAILRASGRSWANAERIKGHLGLFEITGTNPVAAVASSTRLLLDRYLAVTPRGLCMDQFDKEWRPAATVVPASVLYHCVLAFSEVLRLRPKLMKLG